MNPFSPPSVESIPVRGDSIPELASLGQRLGGVIIDRLLVFGCFIPGVISVILFPGEVNAAGEEEPSVIATVVIGLCMLAMLGVNLYNWVLITRQGQSLGKIAVGSRIVKVDGSPVDFVSGVMLRSWVLGLVTGVLNQCCLGWVVALSDALFIFDVDRRCLHDRIAGTIVVVAD